MSNNIFETFPSEWVRSQFPAIEKAEREDPPFVFLDNAAGGQVPKQLIKSYNAFVEDSYVLGGAHYNRSQLVSSMANDVRARSAEFLGASDPADVLFGLNATTILRLFATAIGETLIQGDEIIVSGLEHEANVTPWLRLQKRGIVLKFWKPRGPEARLQTGDLLALLSDRTRIVAVTAASNFLGTLTDIPQYTKLAHEHGAIIVVDGVHYAPHRRIRVEADDIDFLVCSGYKFFGPHLGLGYCRSSLGDKLPSLNHYFLDSNKLEIGAQNIEGLAALGGVFDYFDALADKLNIREEPSLDALFAKLSAYESELTLRLLRGMSAIKGITIYGISDPEKIDERVATVAFLKEGLPPEEMSRKLCAGGFGVRFGHLYAPRLADHLRVASTNGVVRISLCHYNTADEVDRLLEAIELL